MEAYSPQPAPSGRILREYFLQHVPLVALESIYNDSPGLYESTYNAVVPEAGHHFGQRPWAQLREAAFQNYLANTFSQRHAKDGVEVVQSNNPKNTHPFSIIRCGPVWISIHCVKHHFDVPRPAVWRNEFAKYIWQGRLFDPWNGDDLTRHLSPEKPLFAHLIHSPAKGGPRRPLFMAVQFPNERADAFVHGGYIDVPTILQRPDFGFDEDFGQGLGPA